MHRRLPFYATALAFIGPAVCGGAGYLLQQVSVVHDSIFVARFES